MALPSPHCLVPGCITCILFCESSNVCGLGANMLTEKFFDTGELIINFAEGETVAPPLVVLHGATLRWQRMSELLPGLEPHGHIYACDGRGHGRSQWTRSGYHLSGFARDTSAFIEQQVGQQRCWLVIHWAERWH